MQEVISEEEKQRLSALEIKNSLGGVEKDEEAEMFDLRKKKKLHEAIMKNHS